MNALTMLIAIILGFVLIAAGITGHPGSIFGALADASAMQDNANIGAGAEGVSNPNVGGGSAGDF